MNKALKSVYSGTTLILLSLNGAFAQCIPIKGTSKRIPDGTWIYLRLAQQNLLVDSTQVLNNRFVLQGPLPSQQAVKMVLHTTRNEDYASFWAEDKPMEIYLEKGEFDEASIAGSQTEKESLQFYTHIRMIKKERDSIRNILRQERDTLKQESFKMQLTGLDKRKDSMYINHVRKHPNSFVSVHILDALKTTWGKELTKELYSQMGADIQQSSYGQNINDFLAIQISKEHKIGDRYTDSEQANTEGKLVKLSEIKGKYVLLDFWAAWCRPCRQENPHLLATYERYRSKGFEVLGVSLDGNANAWKKAIREDKLAWKNVSELNGMKNKAALIYMIHAVPSNFLLDKNGIIIAKDLKGDALNNKLAELLGN